MDIKAILYSYKLYNFNISKDLSHIVASGPMLYIGDLNNKTLAKVKIDKANYYTLFSDDNSSVTVKSDYSYFSLSDGFQEKKTLLKKNNSEDTFVGEKPLVYKNSAFAFVMENENNEISSDNSITALYQQKEGKKYRLWEFKNGLLRDSKIYNNVLYAAFHGIPGENAHNISVYMRNLINGEENRVDFCYKNSGMLLAMAIVPQKEILVSLHIFGTYLKEEYLLLRFTSLSTSAILHEEKLFVHSFSPAIEVLCNGKYVVFAHRNGLMVFNTDDYTLEKEVYLPMIISLTACDNDNYCYAYSYDDMVVFTPTQSPENDVLIKKIEDLFRSNGLNRLINKRNG